MGVVYRGTVDCEPVKLDNEVVSAQSCQYGSVVVAVGKRSLLLRRPCQLSSYLQTDVRADSEGSTVSTPHKTFCFQPVAGANSRLQ